MSWRFHLDHRDNVSDCIKCQCSLWARSFLRKNPCHLYSISSHHRCCTGRHSSNQPALHNSDVNGVPPLWKSSSDIDEKHLPKVDVRKQQTTLSDFLVGYGEKYNWEHNVFACTDASISCFLYSFKGFCLVFVNVSAHNGSQNKVAWVLIISELFNTGCWVYCRIKIHVKTVTCLLPL